MADQKPISSRKDLEARIVANAWRDPKYKQRLLSDPKAVLQEELSKLDPPVQLPEDIQVAAHEESPDQYHLVLPRNPNDISPGLVPAEHLEAVAPQTVAVITVVNTQTTNQVINQVAVISGPAVQVVQVVNQVVNQAVATAVNVNLANVNNVVATTVA